MQGLSGDDHLGKDAGREGDAIRLERRFTFFQLHAGGAVSENSGGIGVKITKWVDMGAEVEIEIGADDIRVALAEAFGNAEQKLDEAPNIHDVTRALNSIAGFLKGLDNAHIAMLNRGQRKVISEFLKEQAERFGATAGAVTK